MTKRGPRSDYGWLHGRLVRWGNWHLRDLENSDFPVTTALYWIARQKKTEMQESRTAIARQMRKDFGARILCRDMPGEVWETHLAVVRVSPEHQLVLAVKYLMIQDAAGVLLTDAARAVLLGLSADAFRKRSSRAKQAVADKIAAISVGLVTV
ncbi:MAG: hypothetical protein H0W33_03550 [Gammaproteobacteria bacterium]|nr:hypothetical protein [Gammaproteobacteria bacterium]